MYVILLQTQMCECWEICIYISTSLPSDSTAKGEMETHDSKEEEGAQGRKHRSGIPLRWNFPPKASPLLLLLALLTIEDPRTNKRDNRYLLRSSKY